MQQQQLAAPVPTALVAAPPPLAAPAPAAPAQAAPVPAAANARPPRDRTLDYANESGVFSAFKRAPVETIKNGAGYQYRCSLCNTAFKRTAHVKEHFDKCVRKYGNPNSLRWDDHQSCREGDEEDEKESGIRFVSIHHNIGDSCRANSSQGRRSPWLGHFGLKETKRERLFQWRSCVCGWFLFSIFFVFPPSKVGELLSH